MTFEEVLFVLHNRLCRVFVAFPQVSKGGKQVKEKGQEKIKEIKEKMKPSPKSPEHASWPPGNSMSSNAMG